MPVNQAVTIRSVNRSTHFRGARHEQGYGQKERHEEKAREDSAGETRRKEGEERKQRVSRLTRANVSAMDAGGLGCPPRRAYNCQSAPTGLLQFPRGAMVMPAAPARV